MSLATLQRNLATAQHWITEPTLRVFRAEVENEAHGGISPATLSSTIDSVAQGLLSAMFEDVNVEAEVLTVLLVIRNMFSGDTQIADLLEDLRAPALPTS